MFIKMAFGLVIGSTACSALSQTITDIQTRTGNSAYAQDGRNVIVRNPFGLCWRSGYWTPSDAVPGCDGQLAPPVAKITAPAISALPPAASTPVPTAAPRQAPKRCDFTVTLVSDQTFMFNRTVLRSPAKKRIDEEVANKLATCSTTESILITGHADRIGTQQYNQKLSEERANAVGVYLKSKGVAPNIRTVGAGSTQPVETCDNKLSRKQLINCLAPNRRVVIEVKGTSD